MVTPETSQQERRNWLSLTRIHEEGESLEVRVSPQALLLVKDIELAFCAGAWIAVITLCHAAIEATIRQIATRDYDTNIAKLIGKNKKLQRLRALRNDLLHIPSIGAKSLVWVVPGGEIEGTHANLEQPAREAVAQLYGVIFAQRET